MVDSARSSQDLRRFEKRMARGAVCADRTRSGSGSDSDARTDVGDEGPARHAASFAAPRPQPPRQVCSALAACLGVIAMAKKITGYVKLQVPAGAANPSPPIGPALGQRGLNIMEFCKAFNATTAQMEKGTPIPVVITAYADRSFTFEMKLPPVSYFLKKASGIKSGSKTTGRGFVGKITEGADPRDRRKETAGSELRDGRRRGDDDRGLRPFDGPRDRGVATWRILENAWSRRREGIDRIKLYPVARGRQAGQGAGQREIRRNRRNRDESRRRSASMPIRWFAASSICRTARAAPCGSPCSRAAPRPTRPRPRAPTLSAPRISWRRFRAARSTSIAASRRPT